MRAAFSHIRTWVFDLDNTLYPPSVRLFDQIEARMTAYVQTALNVPQATANHLRAHYWETYGTTLAGLMAEHGLDPVPYLDDVHQIDFGGLVPDPALAARITALPGRRIVYTNGSEPYARNVLAARGLSGVFDAVYGVEHAGYRPKPDLAAYETVFARDGLDPTTAAMFEDVARNLAAPHAMGLKTVLVGDAPDRSPFIDHHTHDLAAFLSQVV